jgi:uncharacterized protein with FMN-binding domain
MTRVLLWFMSTVTVVVLLFGYQTSTSGPTGATGTTGTTVLSAPADQGTTATDSTGTGATVTGPSVDTRWGPVQVAITVDGSTITDVEVVEYPTGNHKDQEINARALPVLVSETLDAQSADVDMVSGATVTSEGYLESLQGALDEAGL